jgi:uncharacterized 2Fe-2S/4Fe-4S cluster protein (DUF4445 family)/predicted metal-binding protein
MTAAGEAGSVRVHRGDTVQAIPVTPGTDLLEALRDAGVDGVYSVCGGQGTCGQCLVRLAEDSYVLACRTPVEGVADVWVEETPPLVIQADFAGPAFTPEPEPGGGVAIAFDLGTTTLVAALVSLETGEVVATVSDRNAQAAYGADVIARIAAASAGGLEPLVGALRAQLGVLAEYLLDQTGTGPASVRRYTVAGNTVMEHFAAGLSPAGIGQAPFTPASWFGDERPAGQWGLPNPAAPVYVLPAVAGYVGGDITAGLLAVAPDLGLVRERPRAVLLDLGTNGELALLTPDGVTACATAAGPAFEGAEIECGRPAVAGAIDHVRVAAGLIKVTTIRRARPAGICGSGLVDALAAALQLGLVDETGLLRTRAEVSPQLAQYLSPPGAPPRLNLVPDGSVYLSQADIRQLQLSKGAIAAGLAVLLADAGLTPADIDRVYLAGGFGTKVTRRSLAAIGLIPAEWVDRATAVGNSALAGAIRACFPGSGSRAALAGLATSTRYLELSSDRRFTEAFMDTIGFPEPDYRDVAAILGLARDLGFDEVAALDLGEAGEARLVPAQWVRDTCADGTCQQYGRNWMCPPACPALDVLARRFGGYRRGVVVQSVGQMEDPFDIDAIAETQRRQKRQFTRLVAGLQSAHPRQWPLGVGTCELCAACTYPDEPCRLPGLAHTSMEAAGLVVSEVCELAGIPYHHGPCTITYTSCILLD